MVRNYHSFVNRGALRELRRGPIWHVYQESGRPLGALVPYMTLAPLSNWPSGFERALVWQHRQQ